MMAKIQENLEGKQDHGSDEEVRKEASIISISSTSTAHARMQYNALQVEWCVQTTSTL